MASKHYIPVLDGLRAIAVLLVLWTHIPGGVLGSAVDLARGWVHPGYLGVDIFFVLSGFLITRILLVDKEKKFPLRYFLLRRFFRIFPIYYLTLLLFILFMPVPGLGWCVTYLSNFFFPFHTEVNPLQHTWSLAVEEHFYLIWPFLVYRLSYRNSRNTALFILIPMALVCAAAVILSPDHALTREWIASLQERGALGSEQWIVQLIYMGSMFRFASLALGSLLAYCESLIHQRYLRVFFLACGAFISAEAAVQLVYQLGLLGVGLAVTWWPLIRLVGFSVVSGSIVLGGVAAGHIRWLPVFLLDNPVFRWIGRISYGLYLYHFPIFHLAGFHDLPAAEISLWRVLIAVAISIGVASLSYLLIERPILDYAARFRAKTRS
ncbi:MAG: acyltransferase [Planctomycetes bacterium]|nr:acyltransferase [Planctomycetota bacterium]